MSELLAHARALEHALGDASHAALGHAAVVAADEAEAFPAGGWDVLGKIAFARELVPASCGGALVGAERLFVLGKSVARRDLTLAIATGQCLLGALPVWIAGDEAQRAFVAHALLGGASGALALTERAHGSDLAATSTTARLEGEHFVLDGEKWSINNGSRARYLSLLARTSEDGGPRGFSILLLDTEALDASSSPLDKIRTHGIRGADISGRRFSSTRVPRTSRVGKEGHGLDLVQRTMQVSRTLVSAFAVGGAETALRAAFGFSQARALYGATVLDIPTARAALRDGCVALYVADLVAHAAARALSIAPEQASITSAVAKTFVPEEAIAIVDRATSVLGARHYLREGAHAIVQKIVRDVRLLPLFDGSAAVNRSVLAAEWPRVALVTLPADALEAAAKRARACVDLGSQLDALGWDRLRATSRGECDVFHALPLLASEAARVAPELHALSGRAVRAAEALREIGASPAHRAISSKDPHAHALADAFAAVLVLGLLLARAPLADAEERLLVEAGLARMLARVETRSPFETPHEHGEALDALLAARFASKRSFGALALELTEEASSWRAS